MKNNIFFYSSVKSKDLFETQSFYKTDINILKDLGFNVYVTNKISDFFRIREYDIAFIYFYTYGLFVAIISKILGKKVYFTGGIDDLEESYAKPSRHKKQKVFFKLCRLFSNSCILVSTADKENVKKIYNGSLPNKISLSFHSIEVDKYLCENLNEKDEIFTSIAWMENEGNVIRKGIDTSLKVFYYLVNNFQPYQNYKFIIIGKKGLGSDYLSKISEQLNIQDKVFFTDAVDEETKISILKKSKIYMQLSIYEGFGIAATEALAAKNIVINSGKGGLKDSVGSYGVNFDIDKNISDQIPSLQSKLLNIEENFLEEGAEYVVSHFSYDTRKNDLKKILTSNYV